jgi:hypothetical protein
MHVGLAILWFLSALMASGCGPARLGQDPDIVWWTDHETGSFTDWDDGGWHWTTEGGSATIVALPSPARSGSHSFESRVISPGVGIQSGAQGSRGELPSAAYYSAWFYLPAAITSTSYLVLCKFRSRRDPTDQATITNAWDIDITTNSSGTMFFSLYDHASASALEDYAHAIPLRTWFQVEVYLRAASDATGEITVWIDGVQGFHVLERATMPSSYVEWGVGGIAETITPDPTTLYIDDVAISKRRLGPQFPVFSRE